MTNACAPRCSYDLDAMDREAELRRLRDQALAGAELEEAWLDRAGLDAEHVVLDLGCGPGFLSGVLAGRARFLVGVDLDPELARRASRRFRGAGLRAGVAVARGERLPLADASIDLVMLRFVLQHVPRPVALLAEALRVLRPGGVLLAMDTDDGGYQLHPEPEGLSELLAEAERAQALRGGDRRIGRKLARSAILAGFGSQELEVVPVSSQALGLRRFLDLTLGFKRQTIPPERIPPGRVNEILRRCYALDAVEGAFGLALVYLLTARR